MSLIFGRELKELRRNRTFFQTMALLPVILVLMPVGILLAFQVDLTEFAAQHTVAAADCSQLAGLKACDKAGIIAGLLTITFSFFLPVPVVLPMTVAAYSVVGEKERKSLEPLLAAPIKTSELLLGKSLSAIVPPTIMCWFSFGVLQLILRWQLPNLVFDRMDDFLWITTIFVWTPLMALVTTMFGVSISARARDVRAAQQTGSLMALPVVLIVFGISLGFFEMTWWLWGAGSGVLIILCWVSYRLALRMFERESILTRWK